MSKSIYCGACDRYVESHAVESCEQTKLVCFECGTVLALREKPRS